MRRALGVLVLCLAGGLAQADPELRLVTTTSTDHSGLMDVLLPAYHRETGVRVRALVAATGKALRIARAGDADVLIAHDREAEDMLIEDGFTSYRKPLMMNDFVIVGPTGDPAGIAQAQSATRALSLIGEAGALFASRGDDSGTHRRERALWQASGVTPGPWYLETGSGQGATLNFAAARGAYALTDRGTWLFFGNKDGLSILFEGDAALTNEYGVSLVSPTRHEHIDAETASAFIDWLTGPAGQDLIASHRVAGEQAFRPVSPP